MKRNVLAAFIVFALLIPFQNCGKFKADRSAALSESSSSQIGLPSSSDPLSLSVLDSNQILNRSAQVQVVLNKIDGADVKADWQTVDGSAKSGDQYVSSSGTLTIPAGQTSTVINVPINYADAAAALQFSIKVSNATNGTIFRSQAAITIPANSVTKALPIWHTMNPGGAMTIHNAANTYWTGQKVLSYNGYDLSAANVSGKVYLFDPLKNLWTPGSVAGAPPPREYPSVVWTGDKLISWGGTFVQNNMNVQLNDGAIYDPVKDTWVAMSLANVPAVRYEAPAVWTGTKMLMFGGRRFVGTTEIFLADGGIFDPALNTWSAMSSTGAPSPRINMQPQWTGAKMIVWGGSNTGPLANGAVYDPAMNTWTAMSTANAPSPRHSELQQWTGTKLLVYSGFYFDSVNFQSTSLTDGAMYDPANNTWTPMNANGAPTVQLSPQDSVWTGTKLIVLGTLTAGAGGIFDPATNTWSALNLTGAPSVRDSYAKIYTGSKIIVFGGQLFQNNVPQVTPGGGIYDIATNSWSPLDLTNAPTPRAGAYGVWTGNTAIVFGGWTHPNYKILNLGDGGLFF